MPTSLPPRYLDAIGAPFLFLEERFVTVPARRVHRVINRLPKAVFVLNGTLRHQNENAAATLLKPGSVLLNFLKRDNLYLPPSQDKGGKIQALRLTLPWGFEKTTASDSSDDGFGVWLFKNLPSSAVLELPDWEKNQSLLLDLRATLTSSDSANAYRANSIARLIFLKLIARRFVSETENETKFQLVSQIDTFLESHLHHPLTLADIARAVDRSEEHIARVYRQHRSQTVFHQLRQLRISRAKYLLLCTELGLTAMAEQTGFLTLAHFSRTFKDSVGISPSEFRQQGSNHKASRL